MTKNRISPEYPFKALAAPPGGHRVRKRPSYNIAAVNVDNGDQIHVAAS